MPSCIALISAENIGFAYCWSGKLVSIGFQLLTHGQYPVFKSDVLPITEQGWVRDLHRSLRLGDGCTSGGSQDLTGDLYREGISFLSNIILFLSEGGYPLALPVLLIEEIVPFSL